MSEKKIEKVETSTELDEVTATPVRRWYRDPKNVALAVTSTIAGTAIVVWVRNKLNEDGSFVDVDLNLTDDSDG